MASRHAKSQALMSGSVWISFWHTIDLTSRRKQAVPDDGFFSGTLVDRVRVRGSRIRQYLAQMFPVSPLYLWRPVGASVGVGGELHRDEFE